MNNPTVSVHRGLPKRLIEENVISAEDMMKAVDGAKEKKMSLLS
jgi:hypothetical protein